MSHPSWSAGTRPLQALWQQRTPREQRLLTLVTALLGLALLWQWGLAPAWHTWREAPARDAALQAQTDQMQQLEQEARQLQSLERPSRAQAVQTLRLAAERLLGPGVRLQAEGDQLTLSLQAAPATGLAQWLALAREKTRSLPQQVQLQRQAAKAQEPGSETLWQGSLVLRLP